VIGPLNGPDPSPQAPRLIGDDPDGVADKGAAVAQQLADRLGRRVVRTFVSPEDAWGVVWRADLAPPADDPGGVFRACAWVDVQGQLQFFLQPLTMFDPAASVALLAED
jgi:hypothetical protein